MGSTRNTLQAVAQRRLRNQISNILIFGTLIAFAGAGLLGGAMAGVFTVGNTGLVQAHSLIKLGVVVLSTLLGFCSGVAASFYISPLVLRHAFFASPIGTWQGISVFLAEDEDLPGAAPNIFIAGFPLGIWVFRPSIFMSRTAFRLLDRMSIEAVFAHEVSHLKLGHLRKRLFKGITTFVAASVLTSAMLLGVQWSGYSEITGVLSLLSGFIPAAMTWLSMKNLIWDQEFEADENAMRTYSIKSESLLRALTSLQTAIGGRTHPLVQARMEKLRKLTELNDLRPKNATPYEEKGRESVAA